MKFFTTLCALPLLGAIIASPVPAREDKRLLGLDLGLADVSKKLDIQGLLDGLTKDLVSSAILYSGLQAHAPATTSRCPSCRTWS